MREEIHPAVFPTAVECRLTYIRDLHGLQAVRSTKVPILMELTAEGSATTYEWRQEVYPIRPYKDRRPMMFLTGLLAGVMLVLLVQTFLK